MFSLRALVDAIAKQINAIHRSGTCITDGDTQSLQVLLLCQTLG